MITRRIVWGLIGLAIGAGLSGGCTRNRSGSTTAKVDLAKSAQTALAHTENLEAAEAAPIWKQLVEAAPEDQGLLRNQAVNAVLEYSLRVGQIQGGMLPEAEANRLRQGMQALYETAEQAIGKLAAGQSKSESNDGVPVLWMTAELKRQQSRLLPAAVSGSVRNELVKELLQGLAKEPAPELLGMLLEVIESDNLTTFDDQVADVTAKVAEAHPRNLGVAVEDAIREVMRQGPKAAAKISALADLCSPMAEEIERSLGGSLTDYIAQVQKDLQANDWQTADTSLRSLTNVLRPTQAWRTDQRVLNPHVLDFISVSPLAKLLVASDKQLPVLKMTAADFSKAQAKFSSPVKARALLNVDVDLDDHDELVLLNENQLQVWKHAAGGWELYAATQCAADASLLTWADLFMVDSGSPERFKASRAGLPEEELQRLSRAHDTFVSLVCAGPAGVEVFRVVPAGETPEARLQKPTRPTGMEEVRLVTALSRGDVEGDGDLDLLVGTEQGLEIFINRGNITFYPAAKHSQLPPATSPIVSFTPIDLDRDLDLDIVTLQRDGTIGVLENLLHQQFRFRPFDSWKLSSGGKTWACELNGDASWDLVALDAAGLSWVQTATPAAGAWKIEATKQIKQQGGESLLVADWNFDGWLDSVIGGPQGLRIYLGQSPGEFNNDSIELSKDATTQLELIDFNSDGHLDIAGIDSAGSVVLFENRLKEIGNSIAVRYRGVDDNATGRVNHYAIGSTVELWSPERMYAAVVQQRTTYFGVGRDSQPGTLRAVLTNGSTQHVTQPKLNTVLNEIHVAKGSCPYLYAWNGKEHEFVTDCLWGAPLGLQSSRGKVVKDRPWEFLHLSGRNIQPRDGVYEFWITEELWEVTYLDQVQLMAIDHPADVQVFTNERSDHLP